MSDIFVLLIGFASLILAYLTVFWMNNIYIQVAFFVWSYITYLMAFTWLYCFIGNKFYANHTKVKKGEV